jgi:hypothetical protein
MHTEKCGGIDRLLKRYARNALNYELQVTEKQKISLKIDFEAHLNVLRSKAKE